ncbi:uncharacterized protein N7515_009571 [Penicillium bovifimosum]|uniref:Uncharacterized protein n=1 Tax=Penicillium bovifimosum TaxID=126998 RepID=A0A9W9KW54_9EURO|nr:uncharacterized protein N7515_009571 [Penicillium bovifimosum]KAJ5121610.1 hypothetical protein N7515_009571 [Penicillium bovifimosum]
MSDKKGSNNQQCSLLPAPERYEVSTPEFDTAADDELDPTKRYHRGVFAERGPEGKGDLFHVTGDIIAAGGMKFKVKEGMVPIETMHYYRTKEVGWIYKADYPKIYDILDALPTPTKQQGLDFWSQGPGRNRLTLT